MTSLSARVASWTFAFASFAALCGTATAAPSASATLDLNTLHYSFTSLAASGPAPSYALLFAGTLADACVSSVGDGHCDPSSPASSHAFASDWVSPLSVSGSIAGLSGNASATPRPGVLSSHIEGVSPGGMRSANADRYVYFSTASGGHVSATVDYTITADAGGSSSWMDALAFAGLVVEPNADYGRHFQVDALLHRPATGSETKSGTLALSFDALAGMSYVIVARAHTHVLALAVPEPQTWALMLGGLAFVGAAARRHRRG